MTVRGERQVEWGGPLLWDVLKASGTLEGTRPPEQLRLAACITGDSYTAVLGMGEIALPAFRSSSPIA